MARQNSPHTELTPLQSRLRLAVEKFPKAQDFADKSGIPLTTLNKYLAGTQPGPAALIKMADAAGTTVDYLIGYSSRGIDGHPPATQPVPFTEATGVPEGFVAVPFLEVRASAGRGRASLPAETVTASHFLFSEAWLRSLGVAAQSAELLQAEGDSMYPTIHDGDLMLIDRGYDEVVHGKIYALVVNDLVVVKRVNVLAIGGMILISDNERYSPETIRRDEVGDLNFQGRVAWYGRAI